MIPRQTEVEETQVPGVVQPPCSLKSNLLAAAASKRPAKAITSLIFPSLAMNSLLATYSSLKGWDPFWKEDPSLCSQRGNQSIALLVFYLVCL